MPISTYAETATPATPPAVEQVCQTPEMVLAAFGSIADQTGDRLELVHENSFEDGSSVLVFWKGGETVLAIIFGNDGCFLNAEELTVIEFRDITGIVLAAT